MTAVALVLAVAVPAAGAIAVRFGPRGLTIVVALLATAPPWVLLAAAASGTRERNDWTWLPSGGLQVGLRLDGLSAAMSVTVATTGLAVLVYAVGYFESDERGASALAGLLGFLAAMQGLVLADGYLALLVFWELVGAASARLIAYVRSDPAAAPAATRAFLTTRAADLGFYVAVLGLFTATGSVAFGAARPAGATGALIALGLVVAAMGKSAQAPLQGWLSAAMAGPTPVSALLHSATMVAAGVYLLMRSASLLAGWPLEVAGWIGAVTAVAGAAIALAQTDLKRILAGSTTSQLGLMFVGMAAGGPAVAIFHLIAHAAGKAGMFLAAGIFQHRRGTTSLDGLRGAGREDRVAFAGFVVGALSIGAVPPLAAFWSKEHIAAAAQASNAAWFVLVLLATAGAAAYLLRPARLLWRGASETRVARAPLTMLAGLALTAVGSLCLGALGSRVARLVGAPELPASTSGLVLSVAAIAAGATAMLLAARVPAALRLAAERQLYANELLRAVVERPALALSAALDRVERRVLDPVVDGVGRCGLAIARAQDRWERTRLDAAVDGLAHGVGDGGQALRRLQSGRLYEYLRDAMLGGVAVSLVLLLAAVT